MALLFCDSFDHYASADLGLKWSANGGMSINVSGRNGTSGLSHGGDSAGESIRKDFAVGGHTTIIVGVAYLAPSIGARTIFQLLETGTLHVDMRLDSSGRIQVTRNGTVLGTGTTVLLPNQWYYIELKVTINDTTGAFEGRLNGNTETSGTNVDTRNAGTAGVINQLTLIGPGSTSVRFDDVYVCDNSGTVNNDFLGDVRIQAILPNGNGNSSQLLGSDGNSTDNYLLVDEATPNGDTDFVESAVVGEKDLYAFGNLTPVSGTVYGVQVLPYARKTDAGGRTICTVARLSATEEDSANKTLLTSYLYHSDIRETKPGGGAWTIADVNGAEFGVKVTA